MAIASFNASADATMEGTTNPDTNYGAAISVYLGVIYIAGDKAFWYRSIVNFDLSSLAGETVTSAKLVEEMATVVNGGNEATVSRCTRPATWTEGGVTFNKYDGTNAWTTAGGDYDDTGPPAAVTYTMPAGRGEHEITGLAALAQDAIDNRAGILSLIIRLSDEDPGSTMYDTRWSKDSTDYPIWHMVVDYGAAVATPRPGAAFGSANPFMY